MDVESPSVWTPVRVLIARRCADISSGDASVPTPLSHGEEANASQTHPYGGILPPIPPSMGEEVNASPTPPLQGHLKPATWAPKARHMGT
jgi:hypothetical protein